MSPFKRSGYWQHVRPIGMIADFREVWKQAGGNRWRIAALSAACTFGVFYVMSNQGGRAPHAPPEVTYISSWRADRTDAEIRASNIRNQQIKDQLAAEQAVRDKQVKDIYRTLGKASGMDTDRIEAEAAAERKAEEKAFRERMARQQGQAPAGE
jgi:hypothetical protein